MDDLLLKDTGTEEAQLSTLFHILKAKRRRLVIALIYSDGAKTVRDLSKEIAAVEFDTTVQAVTNDEYRNVYNSLSQMHLPTLAKADIVKYDSDRQIVAPGSELELVSILYAMAQAQLLTYLLQQSVND